MKIGIGITTRNREKVYSKSLIEMRKYLPHGAKLVVVDDASEPRYEEADFRFEENVGIAVAKNKCLELLDDCDHIFLFDDDTYPISRDWWRPYIESKEPHLMYIFKNFTGDGSRPLNDCVELYRDSKIVTYSHVRGCMLYIKREVLDAVGGFDTRYGKAMHEHSDWTNRIFNAGLTTFRVMDVPDSDKLIYSMDEHQEAPSSIGVADRKQGLADNEALHTKSFSSTEYCPYRPEVAGTYDTSLDHNIVLASYLTNQIDLQRGVNLDSDIVTGTSALRSSLNKHDADFVILNDCLDKDNEHFIRVEAPINPYFQRWLSQYQYLRDHPEIDNVFCVDSTDVEMLRNPFPDMEQGKVYVGDEPGTLNNKWMIINHRNKPIAEFLRLHPSLPLLNCGIVGGSREDVMRICHDMAGLYFDVMMQEKFDMGAFNYILYTKYADRMVHGAQVNTKFKGYEPDNGISWWRHK